nr:hypothetical protein [Morchella crassipes]
MSIYRKKPKIYPQDDSAVSDRGQEQGSLSDFNFPACGLQRLIKKKYRILKSWVAKSFTPPTFPPLSSPPFQRSSIEDGLKGGGGAPPEGGCSCYYYLPPSFFFFRRK